jgi:hypothetical protein
VNSIKHYLDKGELNFGEIFSEFSTKSEDDLSPISPDKVAELLLSKRELRNIIIDLANLKDSDWAKIQSVKSTTNESYKVDEDSELIKLSCSPGDIDYNVFYRDGSTYKDEKKAKLLLDSLRIAFPDRDSQEYKFFFEHALLKYHTYVGVYNENFKTMVNSEIEEYGMNNKIPQAKIDEFILIFSNKWKEYLESIKSEEEPVDLIILSSNGGTAHKVAGETLKKKLEEKGKIIKIINETTDLGRDPLELCIGFPRGLNFNKIKQQGGDEELYKAINVLANRLSKYTPDNRMDKLREQTRACSSVLSLNTFAHDSRLVADGHKVMFDVIDSGPINGKMLQLARHKVFYGLGNIGIMVHPPEAIIRDRQGRSFYLGEENGVDFVKYPVAEIEDKDIASFKIQTGLESDKLSVLTFGGQGCSGKARIFIDVLVDESKYHHDKKEDTRDILLLGGGGYRTTLEETTKLLEEKGLIKNIEKKEVTYKNEKFETTVFELSNGRKVHVWDKVSQDIMYALSQQSDHFIIKPGASTSQEVLQRQARGLVVYYDGTHPWERGNLKLLHDQGAKVVYDRSSEESCADILREQEGKILSSISITNIEAVDRVVEFIDTPHISRNMPVVSERDKAHETLNMDEIIQRGIDSACERIFSAKNGVPKKDSDRIISLKPGTDQENFKQYLQDFVDKMKKISQEDILSIGTDHETKAVEELIEFLKEMENKIISCGSSAPSIVKGSEDKPIIIWTGFDAMDSSIRDSNGVCNFDVPILNTMFVLWEEIFCSDKSLDRSDYLGDIPCEIDMDRLRRHPGVKNIKKEIRLSGLEPNEIARHFFGSELTDEGIDLAEKMGVFVSKTFVSRFSSASNTPIVYYSDNKIDELEQAALSTNTILWDIELPMLRNVAGNNIIFKGVYNGQVKEVPFDDVLLVRNRNHEINIMQDRRIYTCGMPYLPEWLLLSSQPPRRISSVTSLKSIFEGTPTPNIAP